MTNLTTPDHTIIKSSITNLNSILHHLNILEIKTYRRGVFKVERGDITFHPN